MPTLSGPYPVGAQTVRYSSEEPATHANDIAVPVGPGEESGRSSWRGRVGVFALGETDSSAEVAETGDGCGYCWTAVP
ncbi:hypothetical protein [Thermomonospora umbrina]|uniref:hypothetical protein n=1 Tax=Thermomonospora umbrina TaxID=111806 RepID=UPI000E21EB5E|nr:hypothetical protein [Thermomonospora umbrina]